MIDVRDKYNSFDFCITSYCQASCAGCERNVPEGPKVDWLVPEHMKLDVFEGILKTLPKDSILHKIQFCGELGDPLMHPQISDFISKGNEYNPRMIVINTNAGLRTKKWFEYHARISNLKIYFGIDGIDYQTSSKYRRGVNFDKAYENMSTYFSNGGKGQWHFILFNWNYKQIPEAVKIAKEINADIVFKISKNEDTRQGMAEGDQLEEAKELLQEYWK